MNVSSFLKSLIDIPSPSGKEEKAARAVKKRMEALGYDKVIEAGGNVCGLRGGGKLKVLYDAHMDVVDPGGGWDSDPFKAREKEGFILGRGACDDKGSLASMVYGGAAADVSGVSLYVLASINEEGGGESGIKSFLSETGIRPDAVVIGEPSELMVAKGNRGRLGIEVEVKGKEAHASRPHEADNAIYPALEIVKKIKNLKSLPAGDTFSVTKIRTDNKNLNVIPGKCTLYCDYRCAAGRKKDDILRFITGVVKPYGAISSHTKFYAPWSMNEEHFLVRAALACRRDIMGDSELFEWGFCTNGSYTAGELFIPTVGLGPGKESECHSANEKIEVRELETAVDFYSRLPGFILKSKK
ncbi:MAG: M20/M25/M40 family metallo-hydrolase [Elusimicrobiota bacterium]